MKIWRILSDGKQVEKMSELTREEILKEIEKAKEEHTALDAKVTAFDAQLWLSPEDQVAQKECKKLKLKAKERIATLQAELDAMDKK